MNTSLDMTSEDIALRGYQDPVYFCKYFLEELFPGPIPWVHRGVMAILTGQSAFLSRYGELEKIRENFIYEDAEGETQYIFEWIDEAKTGLKMNLRRFTLIMLPRGLAKTTIAGIAMPLREILYREVPFFCYVSNAAPHAKMQLNNVKRQLTDNAAILSVFGNMKPALRDDEKWSEDLFETKPSDGTRGCAMAARGSQGQIRGLIHLGQRPKKIIVDDLEDKESVNTDEQRRKCREWFYGDLIPALPKVDKDAHIVVLATLLHREALVEILAKDPNWTVVRFGARDKDGDLIWEAWMNDEELEKEAQSFTSAGQHHVFHMEYFNRAVSPEHQRFKPEFFLIEFPAGDEVPVSTAIYFDPAMSEKRTADKSAIAVASMYTSGIIRVREIYAKRGMAEREKIDRYFEMHQRFGCNAAGVEAQGYQASLVHSLREEMFRKKYYFEIEAVTHRTQKNQRILGVLQGRYANHYIRHDRHFPDLEQELLDFREDTKDQQDDCADALAGCITLLDPYAAQAGSEMDLRKDIYEPVRQSFYWAH